MLSFLVNRFLKSPPAATLEPLKATKRKLHSSAIFKPLVWIDCEMTGLDISKDHIIEICCIITDGNLNVIDEQGYESTVYVPKRVLDNMNEWCVTHHGESGLTAKILANPQQTLEKVQRELLEYIKSYISEQRTAIMAGNTIHMDKFFMMKEFPDVIEHLHYRLVDVSSIMEVGFRHNPALMKMFPKKKGAHTARSDIMESIEQLRWYRDNYLRGDVPEQLSTEVPPASSEILNDPEHPTKKAKLAASVEDGAEDIDAEISKPMKAAYAPGVDDAVTPIPSNDAAVDDAAVDDAAVEGFQNTSTDVLGCTAGMHVSPGGEAEGAEIAEDLSNSEVEIVEVSEGDEEASENAETDETSTQKH